MPSLIKHFTEQLPDAQRAAFHGLDSPVAIQAYLDSLPYVAEERDRSPLNLMRDAQCHCLDGGFFAALALWRLGCRPLLIDMVPEPGMDDDHVLALFKLTAVGARWPSPTTPACATASRSTAPCVSWL